MCRPGTSPRPPGSFIYAERLNLVFECITGSYIKVKENLKEGGCESLTNINKKD